MPDKPFDLLITHDPAGEYTRHLRHEETGRAVIDLWYAGKISARESGRLPTRTVEKKYLPRPIKKASVYRELPARNLAEKISIITETYGFEKNSFEARNHPTAESFWQFSESGSGPGVDQ